MRPSKYNITSEIAATGEYFVVNLLTGHADILTPDEYHQLTTNTMVADFVTKGYLINPEDEENLYRQKYLDFIEMRDQDEVQLFFAPTYACNFRCSYCYQLGYSNTPEPLKKEIIDSFFSYITTSFAGRPKYITLFGGEPLLNAKEFKAKIAYFIEKCTLHQIDLSVVTNGYYIDEYLPLLQHAKTRQIQVTLDGTEHIHNARRYLNDGKPTFSRIVDHIDLLLDAGVPVNLRVVADRGNIGDLPALARFAIEKGWTGKPHFKTQIGRNYELHYCQAGNHTLFSRIELYKELYDIIKKHPEFIEFHKPAFSVSKYLFENGKLPPPLFDDCPGCKTEWAFDYTGNIYACTATLGKEDESLGTFYPKVFMDQNKVDEWEQRDLLSIEGCTGCHAQLACGGGCASLAKNKTGTLHAPDCRPVKELIEMGILLYGQT